MIQLSYNEAMKIQRSQLAWYRSKIGRKGVKIIRRHTRTCPTNIHPDRPISIMRINELVPRGGSIENLIGLNQYHSEHDINERMAVSNAIKRGLI